MFVCRLLPVLSSHLHSMKNGQGRKAKIEELPWSDWSVSCMWKFALTDDLPGRPISLRAMVVKIWVAKEGNWIWNNTQTRKQHFSVVSAQVPSLSSSCEGGWCETVNQINLFLQNLFVIRSLSRVQKNKLEQHLLISQYTWSTWKKCGSGSVFSDCCF